MKTLYLECKMGAAGDMLMAALSELVDADAFVEKMNSLGIPGVKVERETAQTCGITGTHMKVTVNGEEETAEDVSFGGEHYHHDHEHEQAHEHHHDHEHHHHEDGHEHPHDHEHAHDHEHSHDHEHGHHHHHTSMADIRHILSHLDIPEKVRADAAAVYESIAEAESYAHNCPVEEIHFHEVGNMDAVADIVGVCLLMDRIGADEVLASPVHVGSGFVRCAHGVLPVPAPATAYLLQGIPSWSGEIEGELCTPTGAALLRHFVKKFVPMPVMATEKVGYGVGQKVFPAANCVRAFLGETEDRGDRVAELNCNIDDMTGEGLGFAMEALLEAGALEVFYTPAQMKKNRPGVLLHCLCKEEDAEKFARLIFKHTTTIGIRKAVYDRYTLTRREETAGSPWGEVRVKESSGYGVSRAKAEFEDLARIARAEGLSIEEVKKEVKA